MGRFADRPPAEPLDEERACLGQQLRRVLNPACEPSSELGVYLEAVRAERARLDGEQVTLRELVDGLVGFRGRYWAVRGFGEVAGRREASE